MQFLLKLFWNPVEYIILVYNLEQSFSVVQTPIKLDPLHRWYPMSAPLQAVKTYLQERYLNNV